MSRTKQIRSKKHFDDAIGLERAGDIPNAIKLYQRAVTTDPTNTHAWNRQMILFRKTKTKHQEMQLIKTALSEFQKATEAKQQDWLKTNQTKADSSRELAQILGLLEPTGLPKSDGQTIEKWQTRLYLMEYRIKNARKEKEPAKKKIQKLPQPAKATPAKPKSRETKIPIPKTKKTRDRRPIKKVQGRAE
ncbi:hypothetical protein [Pedobacter agri]|uniref:hypothetical protein n=1 Tax=Pedobacter agri TaxID=454586 RepID=UPI00292E0614|nr:hypothetical protein [Pedobacter agri]